MNVNTLDANRRGLTRRQLLGLATLTTAGLAAASVGVPEAKAAPKPGAQYEPLEDFKHDEGEDHYELRPGVLKDLERIKWHLWHGNVFQALKELQGLEMDLDAAAFETKDEHAQKLLRGVEDLHT
jgi:hypothetical protein